ncbi:DUF1491 family protein [Arsenicitalea aurantiaca]|uniref:DUF1491 family protein n=1 Tax=Arsenicitalea aurantiaca TaxID=1783274 RepID=A0A433XAA8_9HYPH|nr:DUF1491 family protein [Arsenicitalea aurantiaca]RUT31021.1 DUF1491 family protein [Arsenicitalea aurantiaca]
MAALRSDLWVGAFVRRHNDLGRLCVISRRGDPIAGQILIEVDHLDGTGSLLTPLPSVLRTDEADHQFQLRLSRVPAAEIRARIAREAEFDPDFWVISIDMRGLDLGVTVVG